MGAVTLAADPATIQRRVAASCAPGSSIRETLADGSVVCEADDAGGAGSPVVAEGADPVALKIAQDWTSILTAGRISEPGTYLVTWELAGLYSPDQSIEVAFWVRVSAPSGTSTPVSHIVREDGDNLIDDPPLSIAGSHAFVKTTSTAEDVSLEWKFKSGSGGAGQIVVRGDAPADPAVNRRLVVVRLG